MICYISVSLIPSRGPQGTGISKQGLEPILSLQPHVERSDTTYDVPLPPSYASKATPPTPVAEEVPSASTGKEKERMSPLTSPTALIRSYLPGRPDWMQTLDFTRSLLGNPFTLTHWSSNAAHVRATQQSTSILEEQEPSASSSSSLIEKYIFPKICISTTASLTPSLHS